MLYKAIPVRPVMGPEVFQAARKTEKEIAAVKGGLIQEYYQSLVIVDTLLLLFVAYFFFFFVLCYRAELL